MKQKELLMWVLVVVTLVISVFNMVSLRTIRPTTSSAANFLSTAQLSSSAGSITVPSTYTWGNMPDSTPDGQPCRWGENGGLFYNYGIVKHDSQGHAFCTNGTHNSKEPLAESPQAWQ